ncbi:MAG: DUF1614 domain-containing protein [Thaumarchaeota archaeon]|nr:DUF1614 domain-containing protein [Nitrososphaerota archaeon]
MASSIPVYRHQGEFLFMALLGILLIVFGYIFLGVAAVAFERIGFTKEEFVAILATTFIGSFINIPITRITNVENIVDSREVRVFWATYRIPQSVRVPVSTLVTINLGGGIIPIIVSLVLLASHLSLVTNVLFGVLVSSIVIHLVARRERGLESAPLDSFLQLRLRSLL